MRAEIVKINCTQKPSLSEADISNHIAFAMQTIATRHIASRASAELMTLAIHSASVEAQIAATVFELK